MKKFIAIVTAIWLSHCCLFAQSSLQAGDIAIIGSKTADPDDFAFVLLKDIQTGTKIVFTDKGIYSDNTFRTDEGAVVFTANQSMSAGKIIRFTTDASLFSTNISSIFPESTGSFLISAAGDQIIAFQGTGSSPTFLYALQTNSTLWQSTSTNTNTSKIPPGLTNGITALAVGTGSGSLDKSINAWYNGDWVGGQKDSLLVEIGTLSNWQKSDTLYSPYTDNFKVFTTNIAIPYPTALPKVIFTDIDIIAAKLQDDVIPRTLKQLIAATPPGADIYFSFYLFDIISLANELVFAEQRGVNLHVFIDKKAPGNSRVIDFLTGKISNFYPYRNRLNGDSSINHNKFIAFSKVLIQSDTVSNLICQTSSNFSAEGLDKIQDMFSVSDIGMYNGYKDHWWQVKNNLQGEDLYDIDFFKAYASTMKAEVWFLPETDINIDPVMRELDSINNPSFTEIRSGMAIWDDGRVNIIDKFINLVDDGAQVEIIIRQKATDLIDQRAVTLVEHGGYSRTYQNVGLHTKFMFIKTARDCEVKKTVYMGSQNFSLNALRYNNEVWIKIEDDEIYDTYLQYFIKMKEVID